MLLTVLPEGFVDLELASGLPFVSAMEIAPDGRIYYLEKNHGNVRVIEDGQIRPEPVLSMEVSGGGERGLFAITFGPGTFDQSGAGDHHHGPHHHDPYVYLYFTRPTSPPQNRISRFVFDPEHGTIDKSSEQVVFDFDPLDSFHHNGGAMVFGHDGKLYVGVGDNQRVERAQTLDNHFGKVLRLNPDGSIPTDNPFYNSTTGPNRAIWAYGLRNPFSATVHPETGAIYINDVGEHSWEEVNLGFPGANYGWPITEGPTDDLRFNGPIYAYPHMFQGGELVGCAITSSVFYLPETPQFPGDYVGDLFIADYCNGIQRVNLDTGEATQFALDTAPFIVSIQVGPDGSLYYLSFSEGELTGATPNTGSIHRIEYQGAASPAVSRPPRDLTVSVNQPATFSVVAAGSPPYSYQWQRNGQDIPGATGASYTLPAATLGDHDARFRVVIANEFGSVTSREAVLRVSPFGPPQIEIQAPDPAPLWRAGETITYQATARAGNGEALTDDAFTWWVNFHHDEHFHPFLPPTTGSSIGSFTIPTSGETDDNVWFRIHVQVRDPFGMTSEASLEIFPQKSDVVLRTSPDGLELALDGNFKTTPRRFTGVVGVERLIEAPTTQQLDGRTWVFDSWSQGGGASQTIPTPEDHAVFTAVYRVDGPQGDGIGLAAIYANQSVVGGAVVHRIDPTVSFDWGTGRPTAEIDPNVFSVRWSGTLEPQFEEPYQFQIIAHGGARLWVDGQLLIDDWEAGGPIETISAQSLALSPGHRYELVLEYRNSAGHAAVQLLWSSPSTPRSIIPSSQFLPVFGSQGPGEGIGDPPVDEEPEVPNVPEAEVPEVPQVPEVPVIGPLAPGDYDGDGIADLAAYRPSTADWFILGSSSGPLRVAFGMAGVDIPVPADYDGDGIIDLAVFRPESDLVPGAAHWFILLSSGGVISQAFGMAGDIPVPADYDGDGNTDLAVYRPSTAEWFLLRSTDGPLRLAFGMAGEDVPMPMDFDGDGRADLAVYRPSTADWFLLRSTEGPWHQSFGMAGEDVPVPADFDGDGIIDLAVYRPSTADWFILRSTAGPWHQSFGMAGEDVPAPMDFDGDGIADLTVYRPSTAEWFLLRSTEGPFSQAFDLAELVGASVGQWSTALASGDDFLVPLPLAVRASWPWPVGGPSAPRPAGTVSASASASALDFGGLASRLSLAGSAALGTARPRPAQDQHQREAEDRLPLRVRSAEAKPSSVASRGLAGRPWALLPTRRDRRF